MKQKTKESLNNILTWVFFGCLIFGCAAIDKIAKIKVCGAPLVGWAFTIWFIGGVYWLISKTSDGGMSNQGGPDDMG